MIWHDLTHQPTHPPNHTPTHELGSLHRFQFFKQNQIILISSRLIEFLLTQYHVDILSLYPIVVLSFFGNVKYLHSIIQQYRKNLSVLFITLQKWKLICNWNRNPPSEVAPPLHIFDFTDTWKWKNKNAFQWDAYHLLRWPPLDVSTGG